MTDIYLINSNVFTKEDLNSNYTVNIFDMESLKV